MPQNLVVFINLGGSGNNFGIGAIPDRTILVNDKIKMAGDLPTRVMDQLDMRRNSFREWLECQRDTLSGGTVACVVSRGPAIRPDANGHPKGFSTCRITPDVITAIRNGHVFTVHPSQLGPIIALEYADELSVPAIFTDPISGQILPPEYRLSGNPKIEERRPLGHWLNIHHILQHLFGLGWEDKNIIVCHFGTGFTIAGFSKGKLVNVNDANAGGPFSDTRTGVAPSEQLVSYTAKKIKAGMTVDAIRESLQTGCGLAGYVGVKDLEELLTKIAENDPQAILVYSRMITDIASEIAARANELHGNVDRIVFTGGMANSKKFIDDITEAISWFATTDQISECAGSFEPQAMVNVARQVITQGAAVIEYGPLPS